MAAKRSTKTARKTSHAKGPHTRKRAATKKTTRRRPGIRVGEELRIVLRRERVVLATAGGASLRQIAAELDVSVSTIHEDVNAELLEVRDRTGSKTEDYRDLEIMRMNTALRTLQPVMIGNDHALRVQATRAWVQVRGDRTAPVEEGGGLPSAGPRGECVLPIQVDHRGGSSSPGSRRTAGRGAARVQRPQSDDRAWPTGVVQHRKLNGLHGQGR